MKSYIAVSALVAVVAAQNNGTNTTGTAPTSAARNCKDNRTLCQSGAVGACDTAYTQCAAACEAAYNTSRVAPNANQAQSVANYATCLGQLPTFLNGGAAAAGAGSTAACDAAYNAARIGPNANQAQASSDYAACLGRLAAGANTSATSTAVVTKVVNSYVTYCPAATSFYNNGQLYVATAATTITVTNCPCTVTSTIGSGTGKASATGPAASVGTTGAMITSSVAKNTTSTVTAYKGAAASGKFVAGGLSAIAAVAGVLAFAL